VPRPLSKQQVRQASPDPTAADRVLCAAIAKGDVDQVRRLLKRKADPSSVNHWGEPAILLAAKSGNAAIARALLDAGADIDDHFQNERAISYAVARNHVDVVRLLLEEGASTEDAGKFGLVSIAADHGAWDVLRLLLSAGGDINACGRKGHSALQAAAGQGLMEIVRELLAAGADVKARGNRDAVRDAVANGHEAVAMELIIAGAMPRVPGKHRILAVAAGAGLARVVEALLGAEADPNFKETGLAEDATALIAAAVGGHLGVVKMLIAAGANVAARDAKGRTALDRVEEVKPVNQKEIVAALKEAGAGKNGPRARTRRADQRGLRSVASKKNSGRRSGH
jgi:ankyrin repeat protein